MDKINIAPFYVSQEIVANRDHSQGLFNKGDEFVVKSIRMGCCDWEIDIGIKIPDEFTGWSCYTCGKSSHSDICWFKTKSFSPKLQIKDFVSMKQLAERQLELVSGN